MTKNIFTGAKKRKLSDKKQDVKSPVYCLKKKRKSKNYRGQRGKQKIPPSGHLAATIQIKKGRFYPRLTSVTEEERRAKLYDYPEDIPQWFVWIYQWKEKDQDDFWKTRSKSVPNYLVHSVKYMIGAEKSVKEILNFIRQHS